MNEQNQNQNQGPEEAQRLEPGSGSGSGDYCGSSAHSNPVKMKTIILFIRASSVRLFQLRVTQTATGDTCGKFMIYYI